MYRCLRWIVGLGLLASLTLLPACASGKPDVICALENPLTGERVELYQELWFKTPPDYDEARHIEQWKAEQAERGFTRPVDS